MDCAFVSGCLCACIPWVLRPASTADGLALPLDDAKVRTEFGVVDRLRCVGCVPLRSRVLALKLAPTFPGARLETRRAESSVLDNLLRGVHDEVVVRFYDPSTGALAPHKY